MVSLKKYMALCIALILVGVLSSCTNQLEKDKTELCMFDRTTTSINSEKDFYSFIVETRNEYEFRRSNIEDKYKSPFDEKSRKNKEELLQALDDDYRNYIEEVANSSTITFSFDSVSIVEDIINQAKLIAYNDKTFISKKKYDHAAIFFIYEISPIYRGSFTSCLIDEIFHDEFINGLLEWLVEAENTCSNGMFEHYEERLKAIDKYLDSCDLDGLGEHISLTKQILKIPYNNNVQLKEPAIGMTSEEVRNSTWGSPSKINKTTTAYGVSEQWVYSNNRYIYLDDGIVTAIQE